MMIFGYICVLLVVLTCTHGIQPDGEWSASLKHLLRGHKVTVHDKNTHRSYVVPCVPSDNGYDAVTEGDIIVGKCRLVNGKWRKVLSTKSAIILNREWPHGVVPYQITSTTLSTKTKNQITMAIREWKENTVIRIIPKTASDTAYISILGSSGTCSSAVGRTGGAQSLNLDTSGLCGFGASVHEFGHAIGFWHEQSRTDRDEYVQINFQNIQEAAVFNFNTAGTMNRGYAYDSIMHYGPTAFGNPQGSITITKVTSKYEEWKQATGLSIDIGNRNHLAPVDSATANDLHEKCFSTPPVSGKTSPFWDVPKVAQQNDEEVWTVCKSNCANPGRKRSIFCRNPDGTCSPNNVACANEPDKPDELDYKWCFLQAPSSKCTFENGPCFLDPFHPDGMFAWTAGYDDGAGASRRGPSGSAGGANEHWYYFFQSRGRPPGSTAVMASIPLQVKSPTNMTFKYYWNPLSTPASKFEVYQEDCKNNRVDLMTLDDTNGQAKTNWQEAKVTLSPSASVVIKFKATRVSDSYSQDVAIDDIFIDAGATVIKDPNGNIISVEGGSVTDAELPQPGKGLSQGAIIGITLSVVLVVLAGIIAYTAYKNRSRVEAYHRNPQQPEADVDISGMHIDPNPFGSGKTLLRMKNTSRNDRAAVATTNTVSSGGGGGGGGGVVGASPFLTRSNESTQPARGPPLPSRPVPQWIECTSTDGYTYYYNETTGESTWDAPPGFA